MNRPASSHFDPEKAFVVLGRIGRPHGVRGMLHVDLAGNHLRDFVGQNVGLCPSGQIKQIIETPKLLRNLILEKAEPAHGEVNRVAFATVNDREGAAQLTNLLIVQPIALMRQNAREQHGSQHVHITQLWYFEMFGLKVIDPGDGNTIGMITAIEDMGRNTLVTIALAGEATDRYVEIPLEYPHWGEADLERQEITLAEWRHFTEG